MKTTLLLTLGITIASSGFSQKNNDFTLVPKGNFTVKEGTTPKTISVDNFWMSNEITNKEFREFYNQIKNSPNDSISWIDISRYKNDGTSKAKVISIAYSNLIDKLMVESAWKSVFGQGDYFTNPNYDNYPVVGVTWEGARYYCIWRTKEENKTNKGQNKATKDYRLPTEYEWEYAMSYKDQAPITPAKELHKVNQGDRNKLGLLNLEGNVTEWTISSGSNEKLAPKVVKGSSWKNDSKANQPELVLPNKGTDYIGFRVVCSTIENE